MQGLKSRVVLLLVAVAMVGWASQTVQAVVIDRNGGWDIRVFDNDDQFVGITVDQVTDDTLFIELDKIFGSSTFESGIGQSIRVEFAVRPDAPTHVPNIVILDEFIGNNTGRAWSGFHMILIDNDDPSYLPQVGFDPEYIFESTQDVPFDTIAFEGTNGLNGLPDRINFSDGLVPDGANWAPGLNGTASNSLLIRTNLKPGELFRLKEFPTTLPTLPEPACLTMLALGGLTLLRKGKKRSV